MRTALEGEMGDMPRPVEMLLPYIRMQTKKLLMHHLLSSGAQHPGLAELVDSVVRLPLRLVLLAEEFLAENGAAKITDFEINFCSVQAAGSGGLGDTRCGANMVLGHACVEAVPTAAIVMRIPAPVISALVDNPWVLLSVIEVLDQIVPLALDFSIEFVDCQTGGRFGPLGTDQTAAPRLGISSRL
jgi:hypothetical protein